MSIISIHKETNKFNGAGDTRIEYVIRDHQGNAISAFSTKGEAETAELMLCGMPGDLAFYDYQAQVWYPIVKQVH